jgi:hypothetical protein
MKGYNVAGQRFGRLLAMERVPSPQKPAPKHKRALWRCLCDCGNTTIIESYSLRKFSRSCGCGREVSHLIHGKGGIKLGKRDQGYCMWVNAKTRAKTKNLPFNLTVDDVNIPPICPVLGIPLIRSKRGFAANSPSLDRIKPDKGYVKGNVQVISFKANRIKNDATIEEMEKVLAYMRLHDK